jgi:hypothetical protein
MTIQDRLLQWIQQNVDRGARVNRLTAALTLNLTGDQVDGACKRLFKAGKLTTRRFSGGLQYYRKETKAVDTTDYKAKCAELVEERNALKEAAERKIDLYDKELTEANIMIGSQRAIIYDLRQSLLKTKARVFDIVVGALTNE